MCSLVSVWRRFTPAIDDTKVVKKLRVTKILSHCRGFFSPVYLPHQTEFVEHLRFLAVHLSCPYPLLVVFPPVEQSAVLHLLLVGQLAVLPDIVAQQRVFAEPFFGYRFVPFHEAYGKKSAAAGLRRQTSS